MTKSLDLKRDDPRSHPFDTTAPSISRRALDHADLLSGDYWGELRTFLWVAKAGSLSKAAELLGSSHATVGRVGDLAVLIYDPNDVASRW